MTISRHERLMRPLLVAVIAMAFTLPTWAAVLQASVAAFSLGFRLARPVGPRLISERGAEE